ncbi:DUF1320 domain-containing protein [Pseudomonas sp. ZM23]|uniref:DUF1320 domain-containing protein n=1 Tax=Pseudomonas triclosanedens TaxID=2961893 RepID=A0ABY6ZYH5_9PSED|nr:DUF1320 domain-containing protein [Pseudomonas triclosanedens]MCP8465194.1 DUF1320 domain-containing protein [Pseudomonas triclosanedens]MCP8470866.1 DUF1320 domain-containing protein [Pseudomonas triclosanedens]MCP8476565.1 DUF1320 domain-containing protein [Pseudomonas triclosanedens]WAI49050.1 DUF1320 domain-containing protein [Pseudomonas triclosanedens]
MSYCTQADLVEQYGEAVIRQLSDRVNKPATAIDPAVVDQAIADADAEIDLHLHARYQLPLAEVPTVLKRVACVLAYANLHTQVQEDHPALQDAERKRKLLGGISTGKLSLALSSAGTPAPIANTVQISQGRNDWGNTW